MNGRVGHNNLPANGEFHTVVGLHRHGVSTGLWESNEPLDHGANTIAIRACQHRTRADVVVKRQQGFPPLTACQACELPDFADNVENIVIVAPRKMTGWRES